MLASTKELRRCFGSFATGVTIVTTSDRDGEPVGITVNSFTSVSLEPPLVLFCVDNGALSADIFQTAPAFAINVLSEDQRQLSNRFAKQSADKWSGISFDIGDSGCPLLRNTLAKIDCSRHATYDAGDHTIILGQVLDMQFQEKCRPLLFHRGQYLPLSDEPSKAVAADTLVAEMLGWGA
jgi:flavin reductase (DIM6/NTAB) family NADH-FMN oxidoreductase RutF